MAVYGSEEFLLKISKLKASTPDIAQRCVYAGVKVLADEIKRRLKGVLSPDATDELVNAFGVTPIEQRPDGVWNAKMGFDGYSKKKTKKYPKGVPLQLLARVKESGAHMPDGSFRKPQPFLAPAIRASRARVNAVMNEEADKIIKKLTK